MIFCISSARVVIEPRRHPEARAQRRADHAGARGRADQRELRQLQPETARLRSLIDDDIEPVILHRRIEIFLDRRLQPMDFVDEKHVAFFQTGEQARELARFFDHRSAGVLDVHAHRVGDDVGERGFAEAGRAAQQNVLEHIAAFLRRLDHQLQTLAHLHLAGELAEHRRPQRDFESGVRLGRFHRGWSDGVVESCSGEAQIISSLPYSKFFVSTSSVPRGFRT